ncbi:hypothetical protein NFI96_030134 [Prochilodus magdalenae]|nr:hypothetical protein NFI96_030134 [Prochilodus magdalenae]
MLYLVDYESSICYLYYYLNVVTCVFINPDSTNLWISNTSDTITVTWEKPDKTLFDKCYRTDLQYKHHCSSSWKSVKDLEGFSFKLTAPDMKKNYVFKIRTWLQCIHGTWSNWSSEKFWRNDTGHCIRATTSVSIRDYLLVTVLPMLCLLLICVLAQERVRRLVLPIIPDPKHTQERILNIEQFQWFTSFSETCEECEIVEIEVDYEKENQKSEITDEQPLPKPTDTVPESHDLRHTTNTSMYCMYSPESSEVNVVPQCSYTVPGYIVI